jgi:peroxiredoxin
LFPARRAWGGIIAEGSPPDEVASVIIEKMKWRSLEESVPETDQRSLREIFAERKELIAKYVPAEIQAIHARAVAEIKQSGIAERALQPGSKAPSFELTDHNGKLVRSADLLANGPLVICFFRGRWCPFCVGQMEAMNAIYPQIKEAGASLVAISPQTVHQTDLMADQHKLRFPLLSDAESKVAHEFGLAYHVPEYQQEIYRRVFVNLPFVNGDEGWELPMPATYILDRDGTVLYGSANPDYTDRPEPTEILSFLSTSR